MMKIEHSVIINRPVAEVFAYVTRPENTPRWQSGMLASKQTSEGEMGVGTIFTEVRQMLGQKMEQTMEVAAYEPNQKWSFKSIKATVPHEAHLTFEAVENGTRINLISLGRPQGLFKLVTPIISRQLKKEFVADFENLKHLLERLSSAEG